MLTRGRLAWALALAAAVLAYSQIWREAPFLVTDSGGYLVVAQDLADGELEDVHLRTPGYPLLLLATGSAVNPTQWLLLCQLGLHFAAVLLCLQLLRELGLGRRWRIAFGCFASAPHLVQTSAFVLSENLAQFVLVAGVVALARRLFFSGGRWWLVLASLSLGFAALVRPSYQLLWLAVVLWLALLAWAHSPAERKRYVRAMAAVGLSALILVGGFAVHNATRFGYAGISLTGYQFTTRMANYVEYLPDRHSKVREILVHHRNEKMLRERHHRAENYISAAIPDLERTLGLNRREISKLLGGLNLQLVLAEPRSFVREVFGSAVRYWEPYTTAIRGLRPLPLTLLWTVVHVATVLAFFAAVFTPLAVVGTLVSAGRRFRELFPPFTSARHAVMVLLVVVVLYNMAISVLFGTGEPRYRTPTDLLLLCGAFLGTNLWLELRRRLARRCQEPPSETPPDGSGLYGQPYGHR